jgi:predicted permease
MRATSFEFMAQQGLGAVHLTGVGEPHRLRWFICTERTLEMFGIKMALGRTFLPEEFELGKGRFFSEYDDAKAPKVAIVNQTLARQHFPNQNPIGRRITTASGAERWREIVGVVGDVGQSEIGEIPPPQIYEPMPQKVTLGSFNVVVRGHGDPVTLLALVKREVHALDPNLPVVEMSTVEDFLHARLSRHRLTLQLLTAFGLVGLIIAAIGIYAVMAFSVSQRTVEIGIRMALGAQKQEVLALVFRQGARLVGAGFALGILGAFVTGSLIQTQLYATSIFDPVALAGVTVLFAGLAALACWLPARRAMKVDPIVALRAE